MLKKTLINFGVVSAALLLTFACAEFLFRAFGVWTIPNSIPDWYRPAAVAGVPFVLKPDLHAQWGLGSVISNADGLRDARAPNAGKTAFRVLALGDSVTFGFGVDQNDTFPRWMEKLAADAGGGAKIEVINAGMNGFNAQNEADFLPYLLDRYKADAVVWTLIGNDFDDSLAVAPNGEITWPADYVVNSAFLFAWGYTGAARIDAMDFRHSMSRSAVADAEGQPIPDGWFAGARRWFDKHSVVAAMTSQALSKGTATRMVTPYSEPAGQQVEYLQEFPSTQGKIELPGNVAMFHSSDYVSRGRAAIAQARKTARERNIPLLVINAALPIGQDNMKNDSHYFYFDASTLLREPFNGFHKANNLGWDPHLSPNGNKRLARSVLDGLVCVKLMSRALVAEADARCGEISQWQALMGDYWKAYEDNKKTYIAQLKPAIDFDGFSGIHQIMGGIFPQRTFPNGSTQAPRANLILRVPAGGEIELRAETSNEVPTRVEIEFKLASSVLKDQVVFDRNMRLYRKKISELMHRHPEETVLEIVLRCTDAKDCKPIRLHRIGQRAPA